ncbi:conserved hypothetical protein [Vibrio jasicida]|uniref:Sulfate adenylyltransferase n=1 Tax=Vibrio jasicida TaxID=766224 RepID=A0AAU9QGE3_9VIBR|nr:conserved hypothetical protein [Vibrio jasicida]CAH1572278.1 conserved hypothetical protein [Vibrio jasicida]
MGLIIFSLLWLDQEVPMILLERTQKAFQSIEYASDQDVWGKGEYWATPAELLDRTQGDCEDVAIAKYFLLIKQGIPLKRLRLAYQLLEDGDVHMLLEYHHKPYVYLLDIQTSEVSIATYPHFNRQILSFNHDSFWVNQQRSGPSQPKMRQWRELLLRYHANEDIQHAALHQFLTKKNK